MERDLYPRRWGLGPVALEKKKMKSDGKLDVRPAPTLTSTRILIDHRNMGDRTMRLHQNGKMNTKISMLLWGMAPLRQLSKPHRKSPKTRLCLMYLPNLLPQMLRPHLLRSAPRNLLRTVRPRNGNDTKARRQRRRPRGSVKRKRRRRSGSRRMAVIKKLSVRLAGAHGVWRQALTCNISGSRLVKY